MDLNNNIDANDTVLVKTYLMGGILVDKSATEYKGHIKVKRGDYTMLREHLTQLAKQKAKPFVLLSIVNYCFNQIFEDDKGLTDTQSVKLAWLKEYFAYHMVDQTVFFPVC